MRIKWDLLGYCSFRIDLYAAFIMQAFSAGLCWFDEHFLDLMELI